MAADDPRPTTTPERLRGDIDAGRTGDKVAAADPAAAPLGADAEAAGAPTRALRSELRWTPAPGGHGVLALPAALLGIVLALALLLWWLTGWWI